MTLQLFYHPLASYCWKALIALHESKLAFEPLVVNLGDPAARAALERLWPFAKLPVLRDSATGDVTPESTILLERLALSHASARWLLPADAEKAMKTRAMDRFFDMYVHEPMQKIVGDRLRATDAHDPAGVESARATLTKAYAYLDSELTGREWANGQSFSLADCAAYPALYYANRVHPIPIAHATVISYLARLSARESMMAVMSAAAPYMHMFPT